MLKRIAVLLCVCVVLFGGQWPIYKIGVQENIPYLGEGRKECLDLYYPADAKPGEKFPGVVIIHGGGWAAGSKDGGREVNIASNLVRMGYVCVSIDYVLSKRGNIVTWPQNFMDCKTAVQWLRVNAEKLHLDPEKIGCIGGSAGGHLSALLAVGGKDMGLEPTTPYGAVDTSIQAGVNLYGIMDLAKWRFMQKDGTPIEGKYRSPSFLGKKYADAPELWKLASPIFQLDKNDPPILQIHGLKDTTVDWWQARDMEKALNDAGIENELMLVPGIGHTFALQAPGSKTFPKEIRPAVIRFFDHHLKGLDDDACKERYEALLAWEAAHPEASTYWTLNGFSGILKQDLGNGRWIMLFRGNEIEIQLRPNTPVKVEKEASLEEMADGLCVNGVGRRNGEVDFTLNRLVILDRSYGRMVMGQGSFLNATLKKTDDGWSIEATLVGQTKSSVWPLKMTEKTKVFRRQNGTQADIKPGMRAVQMGGKCAGDTRLVDFIVVQ